MRTPPLSTRWQLRHFAGLVSSIMPKERRPWPIRRWKPPGPTTVEPLSNSQQIDRSRRSTISGSNRWLEECTPVKDSLGPGVSNQAHHTVTKEMSAPHLPVAVLSTPTMVGLIEGCCLLAAAPHLTEGETTVGTHVCVSHEAAVYEGEQFDIRCRLASVEKRRLNFEIEVESPRGIVSRGTHQRAVIDASRIAG